MFCHFHYSQRPPKTAKVSRKLWDAITEVFGFEPDDVGLYSSEGGFRDWFIGIAGESHSIDCGPIGGDGKITDPMDWALYIKEEKERLER